MADLPKVIRVGPYRYDVFADAVVLERTCKGWGWDSDNTVGLIDKHQLHIVLAPGKAPDIQRQALLHEVVHACTFMAEMDDGRKYAEEEWAKRVSPILQDTLQRNPDLVAYLLDTS